MTNEQNTTPAEAIAALQAQLDALDDDIGQAAGSWRELAVDPGRAAVAASRLGDLERQREILRTAHAEATAALQAEQAAAVDDDFERRAAAAAERLLPLLDARCGLGAELQTTVERLGALVQALHDQGLEIVRTCDAEMASVSGVAHDDAVRCINSEDLHSLIGQVLARHLGRLWPEEIAPSSFGVRVEDRIRREAEPVARAFRRGIAQRVQMGIHKGEEPLWGASGGLGAWYEEETHRAIEALSARPAEKPGMNLLTARKHNGSGGD